MRISIKSSKYTSCALGALFAMGYGAPAVAQAQAADDSDQGAVLEQIIVTAQKRAQNAQQVPIVVNSISAEAAAARGVEATTDLPQIAPGLMFNRGSNASLVFMRGVGGGYASAGQENPVAIYVDDVYVYSIYGNMFDLAGIDRVEVLSGPQGTLFGRNALGGVVQVITKEPKATPSVEAKIGYGTYDTVRADLYATSGLGENLAADLAVHFSDQGDGYGKNLTTGKDVFVTRDFSARSKLLWNLADATSLQFTVLYDKFRSDQGLSGRLLPGSIGRDGVTTAPADFYDVKQNLFNMSHNTQWQSNIRLIHDFGGVTLKNVAAYVNNKTRNTFDNDNTPAVINEQPLNHQYSKTWTNELQLSSNNKGGVTWIAGLFYLNNKSGYTPVRVASATGYSDFNTQMKTQSYAAYGQTTVPLGESTNITAGLRYTYDKKHNNVLATNQLGAVIGSLTGPNKDHWSKLTWRLSLDQEFAPGILGYATYSRGFKAGTFNTTAGNDPGVDPEQIDDYEVGLKTELFNRRVRLNVAGFYYNYKDIQFRILLPSGGGTRILNAAKSEHYGIDASLEAVITDELRLQAGMEWLHAKFKKFLNAPATSPNINGSGVPTGGNFVVATNYSGRDMLSAPDFVGNIGAQYTVDTGSGKLNFAASYNYNSGHAWTLVVDDRARQKAYGVLNLSTMWTDPSEKFDVQLWGRNVTGTKYNAFVISSANGDYGSPAAPATFGITFGAHF